MRRCPITYNEIENGWYSKTGLRRLNPALTELHPLPLDYEQQIEAVRQNMIRMAIPGVQPKMSAQLSVKDHTFKVVNRHGSYILKPELWDFEEVPQNEDLTMRMAAAAGIEVPFHGLIYARDGSMLYVIRRFDRTGRSGKIHVEDFAQVEGVNNGPEGDHSLEQVAATIESYCTFPMVDKLKVFRRVLFCWLCGNEDMHLKNFSLVHRKGRIELSPAYDLLNTTMLFAGLESEMSLSLHGQHSGFDYELLFEYFGRERLGLNEKILDRTEGVFQKAFPEWERLIAISFLSEENRQRYRQVLRERLGRLG